MTEPDNNTFTATVTYWNSEKKFGFAERGGRRVFFHLDNCVVAEGTPEKPELTKDWSNREPIWYRGCRQTQTIVVETVMGPKGLRAAAWGFVPVRTWLEELQYRGTLDDFAGGHVEIGYSKSPCGDYYRQSRGKLIATPRLTTDPWALHLSYDAYDGPMQDYGQSTGQVDLTISLEETHLGNSLRYGRYALDVYIPNQDRWAHIVFYPSGQWIGR